MQEDIENRTVNLAVVTTKLTARTVIAAVLVYLRHRDKAQTRKLNTVPEGKQSVKDLLKQKQGVNSIDISSTDLKGFESIARKYGIDYAIRKDRSVDPPKYLVFFKGKEADVMNAAFNEYSAKVMRQGQRPSVLAELKKLKVLVMALPGKVINRDKQREQSR
ncbi:MAG: PcfB family protein [Stomatobaculum sp.]|nr:PcfB family protein [Stomatobaculum sp.]